MASSQWEVCEDLIDFSDMLPTIADTTGVDAPTSVELDGRSFLPQLQGKPGKPRSWVYCWYYRNGVGSGTGNGKGELARTSQYKYYLDGRFYDVVADPKEKSPLAEQDLDDQAKGIRDELKQVVERYRRTEGNKSG